jgi:hypothetical protein
MLESAKIPKGVIKVGNPDHPFAYDGPDTLLSESKGLLAIFEIRENENKNPNKLFTRLTNALIVYPASTKMLLLLSHKREPSNLITQFWKYYFSDLIELNDIRKAKSLIRDKKSDDKIKEIKYIQKKLFSIQSQVQQNNLDYIKRVDFRKNGLIDKSQLKDKGSYRDKLTNRETKARANIYVHNDHIIGIKSLSKGNSDIFELQPYYEFVINSEFNVDNGVPYYTSLNKKVLNLNSVPKIHYDPFKPLRIASLFGWLISNSNSLQEIENRIPQKRQ